MNLIGGILTFLKMSNSNDLDFDYEKGIYKSLLKAFFVGLVGIIFFPISLFPTNFNLIFLALLMAAASFISGFFLGNLFGIPRYNQTQQSQYDLNNSLSDISDWLTKIIVGLGLVNIQRIPFLLQSIGTYVNTSTGLKGNSVSVFTICIVLYFSVLGVYSGYNYMRLVLSVKFKAADTEMERKYVEIQKEKEVLKENFRETLNSQSMSRTDTIESVATSRNNKYVSDMIIKAKEKFDVGKKNNNNDTQLGLWGSNKVNNDRILEASVNEITPDLFNIKLKVKSNSTENPIKEGEIVLFALHETFYPFYRLVKVNSAGEAILEIISYGSFTVGAFVDGGKTELEYNLVDVPGVSEHFKNT